MACCDVENVCDGGNVWDGGNVCDGGNVKACFEDCVVQGLRLCGVKFNNGLKIGAAVSGGADSVSLLYSLAYILKNMSSKACCDFPLEVITVNHYMRPKEETCGDVDFVVSCCRELKEQGFNVNCSVVELAPGAIGKIAGVRGGGCEDAARFLRYEAFYDFIEEKGLDFLCLAHNKNDNFETILMRFLQGSNVDAGGGIALKRGKIIRPLLGISRCAIEGYLTAMERGWCNDKTNDDTNYFRNNIRHNLIPFLDEKFGGWEKAVAAGAEKAVEDAQIINSVVDAFPISCKYIDGVECVDGVDGVDGVECGGTCEISFCKDDFCNALAGIKKRVLIKACNMAGESGRISNTFLNDVISAVEGCQSDGFSKIYGHIEISVKKDVVFVKKYIKQDTDLVFFDIIEEGGVYDFPFGKLSVTFSNSTVFASVNGCEAVFNGNGPICVRNAQIGDEIISGCGKMKKVADIYSSWHVANSDKKIIPVISCFENGFNNLKCILAAFLGYKDWIVK